MLYHQQIDKNPAFNICSYQQMKGVFLFKELKINIKQLQTIHSPWIIGLLHLLLPCQQNGVLKQNGRWGQDGEFSKADLTKEGPKHNIGKEV